MKKSITFVYLTLFIYNVLCKIGIDPWASETDSEKNPWDHDDIEVGSSSLPGMQVHNNFYEDIEPAASNDQQLFAADYFYKKNLKMILSRSSFEKKEDNYFEGTLHLEFTQDEFDLIKYYVGFESFLTPMDYRQLDGVLGDRIKKPSAMMKATNKIMDKISLWTAEYHIKASILVSLFIFFHIISHTDWKSMPYSRLLLVLFFLSSYVWKTFE